MVTNPKNNHHPPKPEQTGLRLYKDNSYSPRRPLPCPIPSSPPVPFHPLPCPIPLSPLSHSTLHHSLQPPENVTHKAPKTKQLHTPKSLLTGLKKSIFIPNYKLIVIVFANKNRKETW